MARLRALNRRLDRCPTRHTTRMLGGARRRPVPDYLALACRALNEVIKINQRLRPFMAEQSQMLDQWLRDQEAEAALRNAYGTDAVDARPSTPCPVPAIPNARSLMKAEIALAKSRLLLARLKSKMG